MTDHASTNNSNTPGLLASLDRWMASHPWHPRVVPFVVYLLFLLILPVRGWQPLTYPLLYVIQCGVVVWLLWRYRKLLPELTLSFHWLAVPVGIGVVVAWIWLGQAMTALAPTFFENRGYNFFDKMGNGALAWSSLSLRLLGMSIVVPLFEELFIRSLCLRSFHRFRRTGIGILHVVEDMPIIGEWLMHSKIGKRLGRHGPVFGAEFEATPFGALSLFGVAASTCVFMFSHVPRDWPGAIVCGVAYCLLLAATRKKGLGPVIWAHGITNALLWAYTIRFNNWQFL